MVRKFELSERQVDQALILTPVGYFEAEGGKTFKEKVERFLQDGTLNIIIDFRQTELISSPGVAALLDVASHIVDDFDGHLVSFGLDKHHNAVLEMAGFFFLALQADDEATALTAVRE